MSVHLGTCRGPNGTTVPLLHFDDEQPTGGMLAVSLAQKRAVFTAAATPIGMLTAPAIMLSPGDRAALGRYLLGDDEVLSETREDTK